MKLHLSVSVRTSLFILLALTPVFAFAGDWPTDMLARIDAEQRVSEIALSRSDFPALLQSQHRLTAIRRQASDPKHFKALTDLQQMGYYKRLELRDEYAIRWLAIAVYAMEAASVEMDRAELLTIQREQLYRLRDIEYLLGR